MRQVQAVKAFVILKNPDAAGPQTEKELINKWLQKAKRQSGFDPWMSCADLR